MRNVIRSELELYGWSYPTPKAGLDSWPCYFNENNKTLSTAGDEDDKPAKIFLTYNKLILVISVFFIFHPLLDFTGLHDSAHHSLKIEVYTDDPFS